MSRRWLGPLFAAACALSVHAGGFSDDDRAVISRYRSLLDAAEDPCRLSDQLAARYRELLRAAPADQELADVLAAVEGEHPVALKIGEGLRMIDGEAMADPDTNTVYLSGTSLLAAFKTMTPCPSPKAVRLQARRTVGVYLHEVAHVLEYGALGNGRVETSESELLAYAREARFLAAADWPSKSALRELERRELVADSIAMNQTILAWVKDLRNVEAGRASLDKLKQYVDLLQGIKEHLARLESIKTTIDPAELSSAQLVRAWRRGWAPFTSFVLGRIGPRPSIGQKEANLERSKRYLEASLELIKHEQPGTLAYQMAERGVRLAKEDVAFWGDDKKVASTRAFFEQAFRRLSSDEDSPAR